MAKYLNQVVAKYDTVTNGNAEVGATITVYLADSQTKALLRDDSGAQIDNPLQTDLNGNYEFNVSDGTYDVVINESAPNEKRLNNVLISDNGTPVSIGDVIATEPTVVDAQAGTGYEVGDVISIQDRGYAIFDVVNTSSVTPNGRNIIQSASLPLLSFKMRESSYDKVTESVNINSSALNVTLAKNRAGANQDRWVYVLGDSHGWGQGGPEWDRFAELGNWNAHTAFPHNKGFNQRICDFVDEKLGFATNTYMLGSKFHNGPINNFNVYDGLPGIEKAYPMYIESGNLTSETENLTDVTSRTLTQFYSSEAKFNTDTYSLVQYKEKLSQGLFKEQMMTLKVDDSSTFNPNGKEHYVEMSPNRFYNQAGGNLTAITSGTNGVIIAEYNPSTKVIYLISNPKTSLPEWFKAGASVHIDGFNFELKIVSINGSLIRLSLSDGFEVGDLLLKLITPRMKLYNYNYIKYATMRADIVKPARATYIAIKHHVGGGNLQISWVNSENGGVRLQPRFNSAAPYRGSANSWNPKFPDFNPRIQAVDQNGVISTPANVSTNASGVTIETGQINGVDEEIIYRIDWGSKMQGSVVLETESQVKFRGLIFDNNKCVNHALGGHTVGAWIGAEANTAGTETRDHLGDILNYTPVTPSNVITQIPFVNEYLKQTPIASFKTYLQTLVTRIESHLNTTNNYNIVGTDFCFFTSLRNKPIGFEGAPESAITYDDYVNAAKEFCISNNHAFVDCEKRLFELVEQGRINYDALFNDNNHPSAYANEMIFEALKSEYLYVQFG